MYLFDGLDAGNYKVSFGLPEGFVFTAQDSGTNEATDSDANANSGMTDPIALGQGESNLKIDAGIVREGVNVGNYVWIDTDRDGIQDFNENGIGGIKVTLTNTGTGSNFIQTTAGNGNYLFTNVKPGKYKITFQNIPAGYEFTLANQGDDSSDSDADVMTGMTAEFMVMLGDPDNLTLDAGIRLICDNITDAGVIGYDQQLCGEYRPDLLVNVSSPTGGNGDLEYIWLKNESGSPTIPLFSEPTWIEIPNSTNPNYLPGIVTKTTYYVRCVRREGCDSYAESNVI